MVVSTAEPVASPAPTPAVAPAKIKKKRQSGGSSNGSKSRRSQQPQQQTSSANAANNGVHYVHPRRTVLQQVDEEVAGDNVYDVVKPLDTSTYQNVTVSSQADDSQHQHQQAVYQNMDDM